MWVQIPPRAQGLKYMKRQFSAGGVVFNKDGQVLLIKNSSMQGKMIDYWGFPKGHVEEGESSEETALREIKEETGIKAKIISKLGDSKYSFTWGEEKIFKVVTIYLMEYLSGDPQDHDWEVSEAKWFDPKEALKILNFFQDKTLLRKALELKEN